ncbi:MAG TPA: ABC transporter substrate-binding protein [Stellaceae bacterium]|nr:ABC transporter substrate-binding protein [Stellaceae bacterium]
MRLSRRAFLASTAAAATLGSGLSRQARAARSPDTLVFGLSSYPPNLQPWSNAGAAAGTVKMLIFRGLTSYDPDGTLIGELAESWERDGETAWVFHLRQAVFQNGAPVTAEDVKWTIEQVSAATSTAYLRAEFQGVERVETPDPRTVRIVTKQPFVTLPVLLANYNMPIIARGSTDNGGTPVGAGPFVLKAQERGASLDLVAFDKFYKPGLPKLKSLKMVAYSDENARVAALQAGDVDLIEYVPWQSMAAIEADPKLRLETTEGPFMDLVFNGKSGPFVDARVRSAVAFAIKREEIVKAAFFGRGKPLQSLPFPEASPYFDAGRSTYWTYDPDRARALLKDAGKPEGFSCTLLSTAQYGMHKDTAVVVQQNLADIGIQVQLSLPDWPTRVSLGNRGQYEFAVIGNAGDSNDPDGLSAYIDGELPPSYSRSFGLAVPRLHELLAQGRAEFDQAKRQAIYAEVEKTTQEHAPFVGLAWRSQGYAMARNLQGFHNLPGALTFYSGLTLEQATFA